MIMSHFVENVKEPIKIGHGYFMRTRKVKPDGQRCGLKFASYCD